MIPFRAAKFLASKKIFNNQWPKFISNLTEVNILDPADQPHEPIYGILHQNGTVQNGSHFSELEDNTYIKMYKTMVLLNEMDDVMAEAHRQGRISFYMKNKGEEGSHVGSAAALHPDDLVYAQYREAGVLMWRSGNNLEMLMDQLYGNIGSSDKGKQMPVHYGSKDLNFVTISSPLATQIPQAVGSAYSCKLQKNGKIVVVYFGEGAASEGDAFSGFNFASTLDCPILFFCRNNGYAISTPTAEQYRGDGIVGRVKGLGISAIRVDGNDLCAVYNATKEARDYVLRHNRPLAIEAMTYRVGDHSTSDDSSAYRSKSEVEKYQIYNNPILRFKQFLFAKNIWNEENDKDLKNRSKKEVLETIKKSETKPRPSWQEMFNDVYHDIPEHLRKQMSQVEEHLKKYKKYYPLDKHESSKTC